MDESGKGENWASDTELTEREKQYKEELVDIKDPFPKAQQFRVTCRSSSDAVTKFGSELPDTYLVSYESFDKSDNDGYEYDATAEPGEDLIDIQRVVFNTNDAYAEPPNGLTEEVLLAILIDRFEKALKIEGSTHPSAGIEFAMYHLKYAAEWLHYAAKVHMNGPMESRTFRIQDMPNAKDITLRTVMRNSALEKLEQLVGKKQNPESEQE